MKGIVYTSLDNFKLKRWDVRSYKLLNEDLVEWIEETTIKLLESRNEAELSAGDELKKIIPSIEKQIFFRIHGRCYFLDYYYPQKKIAIEIDGGYHKERKEIDAQRDKDFAEIGIRTIRIKDKDVLNGDFIAKLTQRVSKIKVSKKKKKEIKKKRFENKLIKEAMQRVKQHDKMKHNAKWI